MPANVGTDQAHQLVRAIAWSNPTLLGAAPTRRSSDKNPWPTSPLYALDDLTRLRLEDLGETPLRGAFRATHALH